MFDDTYCPGLYCGRTVLENNELSDCSACPRSYRRNETNSYICEPCEDNLQLYDWLFLGNTALLLLFVNWFFIDSIAKRRNVFLLHLSATFEVLISFISSILLMKPVGSFTIFSCKIRRLSDWYTLFHNPVPESDNKLYCSQEAVYPLYTIAYLFYLFALITMLILRPLVRKFMRARMGDDGGAKMGIYGAMYLIPTLVLIHTIFGGLIYYSYPFITIVISVTSCASHFALKMDQTFKGLLRSCFMERRNLIILLGHWFAHAYGIISLIAKYEVPFKYISMLLLVPLPSIFYIVTARYTDPHKFY